MADDKYSAGFVREVKGKNPKTGRTVRKAWKGVAKYAEDNPGYIPKPAGQDTRSPSQKRRKVWRQLAKTFGPEIKTKAQASAELQAWVAELNRSEARRDLPSASTSTGEYVSVYVDILESAGTVRPSAVADYRTSARRIAEGIGDIPLRDLTPAAIQQWESALLKGGRGTNTVLKYHRLLNSVCKHAVAVRDMDWNPCAAVKKPRRPAPSPNSLTAEQHARLCATLDQMPSTELAIAATIAAYTGMRLGEVCGLRWANVDADAGIIRVRAAIAKAGGRKYETQPKTEAGRRDVPIHANLARALAKRREAMSAELQMAGITLDPDEFDTLFVCGYVDGRYLDPTHLSRSWKVLADSLGLVGTQGRRITFHDIRHSFATRAIAAGADVKSVASVLGHTDARVTLNVYSDADRESKRRAVELMGAAITAQGDVEPLAELAQ